MSIGREKGDGEQLDQLDLPIRGHPNKQMLLKPHTETHEVLPNLHAIPRGFRAVMGKWVICLFLSPSLSLSLYIYICCGPHILTSHWVLSRGVPPRVRSDRVL